VDRKAQHVGKPKAILAATDFSEVCRRAVLAGMAIADDAAARFHVLHVVDSGDIPENAVAAIPEGSSLRHDDHDGNSGTKRIPGLFAAILPRRY
jgi:nucleotide-binding universal stress UspA family protein